MPPARRGSARWSSCAPSSADALPQGVLLGDRLRLFDGVGHGHLLVAHCSPGPCARRPWWPAGRSLRCRSGAAGRPAACSLIALLVAALAAPGGLPAGAYAVAPARPAGRRRARSWLSWSLRSPPLVACRQEPTLSLRRGRQAGGVLAHAPSLGRCFHAACRGTP